MFWRKKKKIEQLENKIISLQGNERVLERLRQDLMKKNKEKSDIIDALMSENDELKQQYGMLLDELRAKGVLVSAVSITERPITDLPFNITSFHNNFGFKITLPSHAEEVVD